MDSILKLNEKDDLKFKDNIILKCLNVDFEKRISIKKLKNDPWLNL